MCSAPNVYMFVYILIGTHMVPLTFCKPILWSSICKAIHAKPYVQCNIQVIYIIHIQNTKRNARNAICTCSAGHVMQYPEYHICNAVYAQHYSINICYQFHVLYLLIHCLLFCLATMKLQHNICGSQRWVQMYSYSNVLVLMSTFRVLSTRTRVLSSNCHKYSY